MSLHRTCSYISESTRGPGRRHMQLSNAIRDKFNKGPICTARSRVDRKNQGMDQCLEDNNSGLKWGRGGCGYWNQLIPLAVGRIW